MKEKIDNAENHENEFGITWSTEEGSALKKCKAQGLSKRFNSIKNQFVFLGGIAYEVFFYFK